MVETRLQVGIDFSTRWVEVCLLNPDTDIPVAQQRFPNSLPGYAGVKQLLLETLETHSYGGCAISGEATGMYWLPFFLHLATDADLQAYDAGLYLLNPRWVTWYKKCFAQDHKTDPRDAYYIAHRTRTHPPSVSWQPDTDGLALRSYTRYRFHLVETLIREKCFASAYLFLKANLYRQLKPFSNVFGVTSRALLSDSATFADLTALPVADLAAQLDALSQGKLPDPLRNAQRLQQVVAESFPLDAPLAAAVQHILSGTLEHIAFLETQIAQAEAWIATALTQYPAIRQLQTIRGFGCTCAAGIGAEIGAVERFLSGTKYDTRRHRYRPKNLRDAEDAIAKIAGLWWPRAQSGDFEAEERRMAKSGKAYLRYYLIQGADLLRKHIPEYRDFYARKYTETTKHKHKRALVLTARKSVGLIVGLLHRNEPYRSKEARQT